MSTSGTFDYTLSNSDIVFEAYDRCQIRGTALTGEHMISARNSINLELITYSNRGVNLWAVDLVTIPLLQGVSAYTLAPETVLILDAYLETYQLSDLINQAPDFSTLISSATVTVGQTAHGLIVGQWINIVTPIAIGGILLSGFYQVATVVSANAYTITAADTATSTVNNAGTLPSIVTTISSSSVTVNLANHGLTVGQNFNMVSTTVGGLVLSGNYTVATVPSANAFTITGPYVANATATQSENAGLVQIQEQGTADPIDRIMSPVSRTEWAMIPDKVVQGPPTIYWYDRSITPVLNVWQPPDANGPYALKFYRLRRIQDANITMGENPDVPFRYLDCICAGLAARLAQKWAPALFDALKKEAAAAWAEAWIADRERADITIYPDFSGYYR